MNCKLEDLSIGDFVHYEDFFAAVPLSGNITKINPNGTVEVDEGGGKIARVPVEIITGHTKARAANTTADNRGLN
jgi:hypothetical protein